MGLFGKKWNYTVYIAQMTSSGITPFHKYPGKIIKEKNDPAKKYLQVKGVSNSLPQPTDETLLFPGTLAYIKDGLTYTPITLKNIQNKIELKPLNDWLEKNKDNDIKIVSGKEQVLLNPNDTDKIIQSLKYQYTDFDYSSANTALNFLASKIKNITTLTQSSKNNWMQYLLPGVILIMSAISLYIIITAKAPPITVHPFNVTIQLANGTHIISKATDAVTTPVVNTTTPGSSIVTTVSKGLTSGKT